jgi:hypothetical protein
VHLTCTSRTQWFERRHSICCYTCLERLLTDAHRWILFISRWVTVAWSVTMDWFRIIRQVSVFISIDIISIDGMIITVAPFEFLRCWSMSDGRRGKHILRYTQLNTCCVKHKQFLVSTSWASNFSPMQEGQDWEQCSYITLKFVTR